MNIRGYRILQIFKRKAAGKLCPCFYLKNSGLIFPDPVTTGVYASKPLYKLHLLLKNTCIEPHPLVIRNIPKTLPSIWITGKSENRLICVLEIMNQVFYGCGDLAETWRKGCLMADAMNDTREEIPKQICNCDDQLMPPMPKSNHMPLLTMGQRQQDEAVQRMHRCSPS